MNHETWQKLRALESRDIVALWFKKIHDRDLSARRQKEITAAAKQAREFFRNSHEANSSVKPLLTFYGVASLARALALLFRRDGGEESLAKGHGLETVGWSEQLSGDLSVGLAALNRLKIRTCRGLFADFIRSTENRMSMHVQSAKVDWRLSYDHPELGDELLFGQLTTMMPDLRNEHSVLAAVPMYAAINQITSNSTSGLNIKVLTRTFRAFQDDYTKIGYDIQEVGDWTIMKGSADLMAKQTPQFMHAYIHKQFGVIPELFLAALIPNENRYSQLCITYMVGYVLGMLARYYPTHWTSLTQGDKGDALWPTLLQTHRIVEVTFPELVAEMIDDILANIG